MASTLKSGDRDSKIRARLGIGGVAGERVPGAGEERLPVVGRMLEQAHQVRGPEEVYAAGEDVWREGEPDQGRVAAVGVAHDRHALRVGGALLHRPAHAVDEIVVHAARELLEGSVLEALAEAHRAPEVDLQHRPAAARQELHQTVVAPDVARPRAAVHQEHHRQLLRRNAGGEGQVARQRQAVACGDFDRRHVRERQPVDLRTRREEEGRLAGRAVPQEVAARGAVAVDEHQPRLVGQVAADDLQIARVESGERGVLAGELGVERLPAKARMVEGHGAHSPRLRVQVPAADVALRVGGEGLRLAGREADLFEPHGVAPEVAEQVEVLAVRGQADGLDRVLDGPGEQRAPVVAGAADFEQASTVVPRPHAGADLEPRRRRSTW
ncbi:MAG: hypothetical protein QM765_40850 [Myxococcales bacterium]